MKPKLPEKLKNPMVLASLKKELDSLRFSLESGVKNFISAFNDSKQISSIEMNHLADFVKKLDEKTTSEGSRAIAALALNCIMQLSKQNFEINQEVKQLRERIKVLENERQSPIHADGLSAESIAESGSSKDSA